MDLILLFIPTYLALRWHREIHFYIILLLELSDTETFKMPLLSQFNTRIEEVVITRKIIPEAKELFN